MKYLKTYENTTKPNIGDYIIMIFDFKYLIWKNYIENHIGQIIKKTSDTCYDARYEVDDQIYNDYWLSRIKVENIEKLLKKIENKKYIDMNVCEKNIKHISSNKEDLETILTAKKYNL